MLSSEEWYQILLKLTKCRGAEEEQKEENKEENKEAGGEGQEEEEEGDKGTPDVSGLTSALKKERADRKRFEKELKELRKLKEDLDSKDATEAQKATKKAEAAEQKALKLASRLRKQAIDMAIAKFAGNMKFRDVNDALVHVVRDDSWVEQDDDDPSEIEVDEKAVEKAVKELADKKKYLLDAEGELEPSGSKFGGGKNNNGEMDDAALRAKYSGLRPPTRSST